MGLIAWEVWRNFPTSGGPVQLQDVQTVSYRVGRSYIQDPFRAGTATVTGRNPQNLPILEIGYQMFIKGTDGVAGGQTFHGRVADLRIDYGNVPAEDTWTIEIEDSLARAGRAVTTDSFSWVAGLRTDAAANAAATDCVIQLNDVWTTMSYTSEGQSFVSAQSLPNTNLLSILNQLAITEQGRIVQDQDNLGWVNRSDLGQIPFGASLSDGSLTATYPVVPFTNVAFSSLADSFYQSVLVQPDGLAAQTAGVNNSRQFSFASYDQTTGQAQNLADYVLATLNVFEPVPLTISAVDYNQTGTTLAALLMQVNNGVWVELILRGSRYVLFVEGVAVSAQPGSTRCTFNVVSSQALEFFILDDASFGVLNQNKLGF